MKKIKITINEAKTHLSRYLDMLREGIEIIIKRGGTPVATITLIKPNDQQIDRRPAFGTKTSEPRYRRI